MTRIHFLPAVLAVCLVSVPVYAEDAGQYFSPADVKVVTHLRNQAMSDTTAYRIVSSLTTEVGSRLAGSPGDKLAVAWAKRTLKALGFDRVWTEPVTFPTWVRGVERAEILAPYPQKMVITALGFSQGTGKSGIRADVVHFVSLEALQQAAPALVRGKIVFISHRMQRYRDGHGYGTAVRARSIGARVVAAKGGVALIIRSIGTDNNRTPHTGMMRYDKKIPAVPAAALSNPDADLLVREFKSGLPVRVHLTLGSHMGPTKTSYNVLADLTGSKYPAQIVLLGGHLDAWDLGTGAIDDGAGIAITAAAAHLISSLPQRPRRTIRVVFFANEETGLWGAKAYRDHYRRQLAQHIVGAESDFGAGKIYRLSAKVAAQDWGRVEQMAKLLAPLGISLGDNEGGGGSDVSPMQALGMPTLALKQDGTRYFDWHHTSNDTLDKIEPQELAQNVAAYAVIAYLSAQMEGNFGGPLALK